MMRRFVAFLFVVIALTATALADEISREFANNREVVKMGLYPPGVIMRQQKRLGITPDQRKRIAVLVRDFQSQVTELQWEMPNGQQSLRELLQAEDIDEAAAIKQATQVLKMESDFKLENFKLLIAIKNELTTEQIAQLDAMIKRRMAQANAR